MLLAKMASFIHLVWSDAHCLTGYSSVDCDDEFTTLSSPLQEAFTSEMLSDGASISVNLSQLTGH